MCCVAQQRHPPRRRLLDVQRPEHELRLHDARRSGSVVLASATPRASSSSRPAVDGGFLVRPDNMEVAAAAIIVDDFGAYESGLVVGAGLGRPDEVA